MDAPRAAHKSWAEQGHNSDELQFRQDPLVSILVQAVLGAPGATGRAVKVPGYQSVWENPWQSPEGQGDAATLVSGSFVVLCRRAS